MFRHGHDAGDAALQQLTATIQHELVEADLFGRLGRRIAVLVEPDSAKANRWARTDPRCNRVHTHRSARLLVSG